MFVEFHNHVITINEFEPEFVLWKSIVDKLNALGLLRSSHLNSTRNKKTVDGRIALPDKLQFNSIYQAFCYMKDDIILSVHFINTKLANQEYKKMFEEFTKFFHDCLDKSVYPVMN